MKRWFSLALVLAMCLTTVFGQIPTAFAESEPTDALAVGDFEYTADEDDGDFISDDLPEGDVTVADQDISAEEYVEVPEDVQDEPIDDFISDPDEETAVEETADEDIVAPQPWYARANASLTLAVDETVSRNIQKGSILLVTAPVGETMLHVVCENLSGDVDSGLLDALTEEELQAFMDGLADVEIHFYEDMQDYPLPPEPAETPAEPIDPSDPAETEEAEEGGETVDGEPGDDSEDIDCKNADENGAETEDKSAGEDGEKTEGEVSEKAEGEDEKKAEGEDENKAEGENAEDKDEEDATAESEAMTGSSEAADALEQAEAEETAGESAEGEGAQPAAEQTAAASAIALNLSSLTLGVKEVYNGLSAAVVDAGGAAMDGYTISWRSSNIRVVKVNAAGVLTAVRNGKATIIASVEGLPEATLTVIVRKAPEELTVTPKIKKLSVGMVLQLSHKLSKGSGSGRLTYTSSNPAVAAVNEIGQVIGVGGGKATITARTYNGKRATCRVTVYAPPATVTTDKSSYALLQGKSRKMDISLLDGAGVRTYANLNIVSSDPNVVAVDGNGNLTGVNLGSATVTITTHNGLSVSCPVDVAAQAVDMALNAATITIGVREKYDRMDYTLVPPAGQEKAAAVVTWKSRNNKIARVNKKTGVITGVKAGTTTIVATTNNKISRSVKVVVKKAPKSVALSPGELGLTVGMTGYLTAKYNAKNVNNNVTYTSSDPGVATVDANGAVTAVGHGSAVITVNTYNGKTATCTVNVYNDPAQVMMSETLTVAVGTRAQLSCSVVDAGGQPSIASYSFTVIPKSGSVEVGSDGVVKGVTAGKALIRVSTQNGVTTHIDNQGLPVETECEVTIEEAPQIRYRVFGVYDYFNVPVKGSLTFTMNNATGFMKVFSDNSIDGVKYENVGLLENPTKDGLLSGMASAFSGSRDTDVNLIFLCSHGTNYVDVSKTSKSTHYGLQLPGYRNYKSSEEYYITSEEIFSAISAIHGKVILVLDSCYSGVFITDMKSALNAQDGRISVMTAASNTTACYYNITNTSTACDFFTQYLLMGAGYNLRTHDSTGAHPADTNQDGKLTFSELFSYAKKSVRANVPKYRKKKWFHGNYKQSPNVYTGSNGDLVLYQYS